MTRPKTSRTPNTSNAPSAPRIGIRELIGYRLQKATYYVTKPSYIAYSRDFGVTGVEWRVIGNLQAGGPLSLVQVSEETDIQLPQASRTIAALVQRGLVKGESDASDGRKVLLSLTTQGKALYRRILAQAAQRHARLLSSLTAEEQQCLFEVLEKLADAGREMLEEERAIRS